MYYICSPSNLFYLTEYESGDGVILITPDDNFYFTDARFFEETKDSVKGFKIRNIADLQNKIAALMPFPVYVDEHIPYEVILKLKAAGAKDFILSEDVGDLRKIKTERELSKIRTAQEITDKAFKNILEVITEGMTERELTAKLNALLYEFGGDGIAFPTIVAFGENTAKPHAHPGDKKLRKGMPVLLDFGAKYRGYCSDMTRTIFFGEPPERLKETYRAVLDAQEFAMSNMRSGMTGAEIDELARGRFRSAGLDKYFLHSLGHSLGLDIHEDPVFSPKCYEKISDGMVLSVEPGLYFEGEFGVRIENLIYFAGERVINLTKSPRDMIIL